MGSCWMLFVIAAVTVIPSASTSSSTPGKTELDMITITEPLSALVATFVAKYRHRSPASERRTGACVRAVTASIGSALEVGLLL